MASGWSPKPVLSVQVAPLPFSGTIRLDQEHVSKTCGGNHSVASSSLAVSASDMTGMDEETASGRQEFDSLMLR